MYDITLNFDGQSVSGGPGAGAPNRASQAAQARASEHPQGGKKKKSKDQEKGKHGKSAAGGDKQLQQAASALLKAAQQLGTLSQGGLGGLDPSGGMGGFSGLGGGFPGGGFPGFGGGFGAPQALALGQSLGSGFAQFAGGGPSINFNFNNCFNGAGDANPFASNFASSFGAPPAPPQGQGAPPQVSGAFAMAFSC